MAKNARAPRHIMRHLEELEKLATMERADFGWDKVTTQFIEDDGPRTMTVDKLIKERTKLWRESWVVPAIDAVMRWAKGESE